MIRNQQSPGREEKKSVDSKKGIFTSFKNIQQKPNVSPYLDTSIQGLKQGLDNLKNLNQSLQAQKRINLPPSGGNIQNHEYKNVPHSFSHTNLNAPKVQFHYQHGQPIHHQPIRNMHPVSNGNNIQYLPIMDPNHYSRQPVQVMRTVIPYHVNNQIPAKIFVNSNQNPNITPQMATSPAQNDQAYQILLKQYQKLYEKLQKQSNKVKQLQNKIRDLQIPNAQTGNERKHTNSSKNNSRRKTNISVKNIDTIKRKLSQKLNKSLQMKLTHKKTNINEKLGNLLSKAKNQLISAGNQMAKATSHELQAQ